MNKAKIFSSLRLLKDVDGRHPLNFRELETGGEPLFFPCTARACFELLFWYDIRITGKNLVIIGQCDAVGLPISLVVEVKKIN